MGLLDETIGRIHPLDREAMYKAQKRWDDLYVGVGDWQAGRDGDSVCRSYRGGITRDS